MNSEKIQALFESMEVAANELKEATRQAKRLKVENDKNETIVKVVKDFNAIQINSEQLEKTTIEAIKRIEKQSSSLKLTTLMAVTIACALFGTVIGYAGFYSVKDTIISQELNTLKTERAKIQEQYAFINELTAKGFKIYNNAIVLPPEFSSKVGITEDGKPAIFAKK